ncbi:MAG: hypothetical protein ACXVEW_01990 [Solirubrobacteraceae bacterium]
MFTRSGRQLTLALAAAVVTVLAISSLAFAAGSSAPVLKTPGAGKKVKAGKIRLVVKDTSADARRACGRTRPTSTSRGTGPPRPASTSGRPTMSAAAAAAAT